MKRFETSKVDGCWICKHCGVAVTPTPEEISEHLEDCKMEIEAIFITTKNILKECIRKGLSTEMILIEALPKLQAEYGLDTKYYENKLKSLTTL